MKVLVTGATGYIGPRLVTVLQGLGHDVRVLLRHPADERLGSVEQVIGNLAQRDSLRQACQGGDRCTETVSDWIHVDEEHTVACHAVASGRQGSGPSTG